VSDWFGYSTLYYQPVTESVQRVELLRGGSALLYGPQPGPALNYVTYPPPVGTRLTARTQSIFGSDGLYSLYNSAGGTAGPVGYLGYHAYRHGDGARPNADFTVHTGGAKVVIDPANPSRWTLAMDAYRSESGEAGRLTLAQYGANRDVGRTPNDRIWIERYMPSLTYEHEVSDDTLLVTKSWMGYQDRFSRRQTGTSANLDRQEFSFLGVDTRLRHLWEAGNSELATTGGVVFYLSDSPRSRKRGAEPNATTGPTRFELDRRTTYGAFFAEQLVKLGRLSIIPAFRLEWLGMKVQELSNTEVSRPLITDSYTSTVPLGAVGVAYDVGRAGELYANWSQGYRPKEYDDLANPTSSSQQAPSELDESRTGTYEFGVRGTPASWWTYDTSYFLIDYDNFIETLSLSGGNSERSNSGRAVYQGWEVAGELDLLGLYDHLARTEHGKRWGRVSVHGNLSLLDAEFIGGLNDDKDPAYAPAYLVKTGITYNLEDRVKLSLTGELVGDHYWQDSNAAGTVGTANISAYTVWDLELDAKLYKDWVRLIAGVNNAFDKDYYARIRTDGIEPAARRTYYLGCSLSF
jgi:Fe(3+) dicitrate transport protein